MNAKDMLLVALDVSSTDEAGQLATKLKDTVGGFKIGSRMFVLGGPSIVREIGPKKTFLDLKFHDITNTVADAVTAAAQLGVRMCNIHCSGGPTMMRAAREASDQFSLKFGWRPLLIGVTVLTSHDRSSLDAIGLRPGDSIERIVSDLAAMAADCGLDGVVCSPLETPVIRKRICDNEFIVINAGIRKSTDPPDDQKRTATPREAINMGASYIVVGRPIIAQEDPVAAAEAVLSDMESVSV
jgi:orotidine-5'-phosphate decarboxylase